MLILTSCENVAGGPKCPSTNAETSDEVICATAVCILTDNSWNAERKQKVFEECLWNRKTQPKVNPCPALPAEKDPIKWDQHLTDSKP